MKVRNMVGRIQSYVNNRTRVPASKAYSVNFPNRVNNPTIGDLARDRIARLKSQYKSCFQPQEDPNSLRLYNEVQNIYLNSRSLTTSNCDQANNLKDQLFRYSSYTYAVPKDKAYTVLYPSRVNNPTIGQLAKDRIERIKKVVPNCFADNRVSNYILQNIPGTYQYFYRSREFQLRIVRAGNSVRASFAKHGYSYPPQFKKAKMISNNGVSLEFELGGRHTVKYQIFHNELGVSAYISESWTDNGILKNLGVLTRMNATPNPKPRPVKPKSVNLTFSNQTGFTAMIYWVNNGKEVLYRRLKPRETYVQQTFSGHQWRARINNSVRVNYKATRNDSQLVRIR